MRTTACAALAIALFSAPSAVAAGLLTPLQVSAACAPLPEASLPADAPRIVGVQDVVPRHLYGNRDLVIIGSGANRGVQVDQRYFIRRGPVSRARFTSGPRGATTAGWLRILAATEATAIGRIEFACDGILQGDLLQPFAPPALPAGADRTDAAGEPDFGNPGRVLFGDNERFSMGPGDFVVASMGSSRGAAAGTRLAIYRDLGQRGLPLAAIGEAVVITAEPGFSVIRLTRAAGAVFAGDLLVPRRP